MKNAALILVVMILAGILGLQALNKPQPQPASSQVPPPVPDTCYTDTAVRKLYGVSMDGGDMPQSWHRQLTALMLSTKESTGVLPADIASLPDVPGYEKLLPLREAMAREREAGGDKLFRAVQKFQSQKFDDLIRADKAARRQVHEILWIWMGVDEVNPAGRGPFIDGRDIALLEKLMNEKFLQLRRYPDPVAVAAAGLKEAVELWNDHAYSRLLWQSQARQLFLSNRAAQAKGEQYLLDPTMLEYLTARARALPDDDTRKSYWGNVFYALPNFHAGVSPLNQGMLDKAIRASSPALSFEEVKKRTSQRFIDNFWDEKVRALQLLIIYSDSMNVRKTCYSWVAGVKPSANVRNLP